MLDFAEQHQVRHFVFSSSCTVYGEPDTLPIAESHKRKEAASPYGNTKRIGEDILHDYLRKDWPANKAKPAITILRYFNPVGAHPSGAIGEIPEAIPNFLVPYVLKAATGELKQLTVFGSDYDTPDGTCIRDYIHVMDLAEAHVAALSHEHQQDSLPSIYNIGTGHGSTVLEVIKAFEEATQIKVPYRLGARRPGDISSSYANADKANSILNWEANRSLKDAMTDAWRWHAQYVKLLEE